MILEGIAGALTRIVPEIFKSWNKKKEMDHEHRMMQNEMEFAKLRGEIDMRQADVDLQNTEIEAMSEAHKSQAKMAKAGGKIVSAISALVRPGVTYWFVFMYSVVKMSLLYASFQAGVPFSEAVNMHWTEDDQSLLTMILTFWFTGRVWDRNRDKGISDGQ